MDIIKNIKNYCGAALFIGVASAVTLSSCSENIDESSLYTFTGEMMTDHFENNPETFSSYLTILGKVHQSKRSASTMKELLDARGNYTCFAPTNEAITLFLDSLVQIGEASSTDVNEIPDSVAEAIVFNSIIENGDEEAFATTSFANDEPLSITNMNGRYVTPSYGNDEENNTVIYVNIYSKIIDGDIEVENGYIHTIDRVLSPSNATIADMIIATENTQLFGECLSLTGWDAKLTKYKDEAWEEKYDDIRGTKYYGINGGWEGLYPDKRLFGFTIFVETDSVFAANDITDITSLKTYVLEHNNFDDDTNRGNVTSWGDDYESDYNWLNQFVAYHILPEKLSYSNMVTFANEYGCDASMMKSRTANQFYVNVWEYWETVGVQRRSVKITGCRVSGEIQRRINRKSVYNQSNCREVQSAITIPGLLVSPNNAEYDNDALNGIYFPIDGILLWSPEVPNQVLNERLRYDITSLFPELLTNNIKQNRVNSWYFMTDYLDNVYEIVDGTDFEYLPNTSYSTGLGSWMDYQIDEFNIRGQFDFTMKLPPVPYTGTYELRYGVWANNNRGMAQIYMGKNPKNLPAIGIPIDLRAASGTNPSSTGWVAESSIAPTGADSTALYENQKTMRNLGFMKGPKYVQVSGGTARDSQNNLRKIIYTGQFEAGETYWIRYKSVLQSTSSEFFYDYIELVPKSVYAGENNEDIW
ncbi:MAG: fasciclin domain-containing protein [Bacteroidaceae bacterium]|nr:fasciclin domain-containing protein [Bacteroidaceae bacterium]